MGQTTSGLFPEMSDENKFWLFALVAALFVGLLFFFGIGEPEKKTTASKRAISES
jgi:hypothetical protein